MVAGVFDQPPAFGGDPLRLIKLNRGISIQSKRYRPAVSPRSNRTVVFRARQVATVVPVMPST